MVNKEQSVPVPEKSAGDVAHTLARAAISAIPVIGGPSAELLSFVIAPPLEGRRQEWMKSVAGRLDGVEAKVERLAEDPSFVTTMVQATQIATRTHQEEKLVALRNAIVNAAVGTAPEDDMRSFFLSLVDVFTPTHLQVLRFFKDRHVSPVLNFERLRNKGPVVDQMILQLSQNGLLVDPRPYAARNRDLPDLLSYDWRLSQLGSDFLAFISFSG